MCGVRGCAARISGASSLRLADKNIMSIETQKEKSKQEEGSRDLFCVVSDAFRIFAKRSSIVLGSALAFASAVLVIVIWGLTGPTFHYSNTWQLIINTGTTIVTFLMVFLIQNTQNRDAKAAHLKLDELIRALKGARNELIDLEKLADEDLTRLEKQFERVRKKAELNGNNPGSKSRASRAERASEGETIFRRGTKTSPATLT
jgi:low affinity Fe/Cu permease